MSSLFGEAAKAGTQETSKPTAPRGSEEQAKPSASPPATETLQQLVTRALQDFDDYQRLTAQGKLAEAGNSRVVGELRHRLTLITRIRTDI